MVGIMMALFSTLTFQSKSYFGRYIHGIDMDISKPVTPVRRWTGKPTHTFESSIFGVSVKILYRSAHYSFTTVKKHQDYLLKRNHGKLRVALMRISIPFETNLLKINWICHRLYASLTIYGFLIKMRSSTFGVVNVSLWQLRLHLWYVISGGRNIFL